MSTLFLAGLLGLSSGILAALAVFGLRLPPRSARAAGAALLEFVALWAACLVANLTLGSLAIIALRTLTATFFSIYLMNDVSIVVLSALQAFVMHAWMCHGRPR